MDGRLDETFMNPFYSIFKYLILQYRNGLSNFFYQKQGRLTDEK